MSAAIPPAELDRLRRAAVEAVRRMRSANRMPPAGAPQGAMADYLRRRRLDEISAARGALGVVGARFTDDEVWDLLLSA